MVHNAVLARLIVDIHSAAQLQCRMGNLLWVEKLCCATLDGDVVSTGTSHMRVFTPDVCVMFTSLAQPAQSVLQYDELTTLTETSSNFKNYRSKLAQGGPTTSCLPYLGLYLTDLTFAEEKNSSRVGPRINYNKFATIASILADVLRFQRVRYVLKPVEYLTDYFNRLEALEDDKCFALSLVIQPRKQ